MFGHFLIIVWVQKTFQCHDLALQLQKLTRNFANPDRSHTIVSNSLPSLKCLLQNELCANSMPASSLDWHWWNPRVWRLSICWNAPHRSNRRLPSSILAHAIWYYWISIYHICFWRKCTFLANWQRWHRRQIWDIFHHGKIRVIGGHPMRCHAWRHLLWWRPNIFIILKNNLDTVRLNF